MTGNASKRREARRTGSISSRMRARRDGERHDGAKAPDAFDSAGEEHLGAGQQLRQKDGPCGRRDRCGAAPSARQRPVRREVREHRLVVVAEVDASSSPRQTAPRSCGQRSCQADRWKGSLVGDRPHRNRTRPRRASDENEGRAGASYTRPERSTRRPGRRLEPASTHLRTRTLAPSGPVRPAQRLLPPANWCVLRVPAGSGRRDAAHRPDVASLPRSRR